MADDMQRAFNVLSAMRENHATGVGRTGSVAFGRAAGPALYPPRRSLAEIYGEIHPGDQMGVMGFRDANGDIVEVPLGVAKVVDPTKLYGGK